MAKSNQSGSSKQELSSNTTSLEVQHERLKLALHACHIGTWDWDPATGQVRWDDQIYENFGWPHGKEVSEELVYGRVHPEDLDRMKAALRNAVENKGSYECEYRVIWDDGSVHYLVSKGTVFTRDGEILHVSGINVDITNSVVPKLQLEERERELRQKNEILQGILDCTAHGVVACDQKGNFILFNESAQETVGMGAVEEGPETWTEAYGCYKDDGSTVCLEDDLPMVRAMKGEVVKDLVLFMRNPGKPAGAWISCNASPLRDEQGSIIGGINVVRDISAEKQAQELGRQRDAFVFTLVHDLKNGIAATDINLNLLLSQKLGELSEKQRKLMSQIVRNNEDLWDMAQNLLKLYRYENKQHLDFENVDLTSSVKRSLTQAQNFAESRDVQLECKMPQKLNQVLADQTAFSHVVSNLLHNAIKFSPTKSAVTVTAESTDNGILLSVEDAGPGISDKEQKRLFRLPASETLNEEEASGTGLGLFLSHRIIEAHGGKLTYTERPGGGSKFTIELH